MAPVKRESILTEYRVKIDFPKTGIECRLKFFDEFIIPVRESFKPAQDLIALVVTPLKAIRNRLEVLVKLIFVKERR